MNSGACAAEASDTLVCRGPSKMLPCAIDLAVDVPGLARHADLVFDLVVVRLELFQTERPIFDS